MGSVISEFVRGAWTSPPSQEDGRCTGKQGFDDRTLAHKIARRMRKRGTRTAVYRCIHCGAWHVGGRETFQREWVPA